MNKKLYFMHLLFYGLCIIAALWQHGDPFFTLLTLTSLIFVGIISPSLKSNDNLSKHLIALLFPIAAGVWLCFRLLSRSPTHILIVESLSLAGLSFFFNINPKEKGYRLIICSVLLIYGAGITRAIYFYTLIPAIIVACMILYLSRTDALIKKPEQLTEPITGKYEIRHLVLHLFIFLIAGMYLFSIFPIKQNKDNAFLGNSLFKESNPPPGIADWLLPPSLRKSLSVNYGFFEQESPDNIEKTGEVTSFDMNTDIDSVQERTKPEHVSQQLSVDGNEKTDSALHESSRMVRVTNQFKNSTISIFDRLKNSRVPVLGVLKGPIGFLAGGVLLLTIIIYFTFPYLKNYIIEMNKKRRCSKTYLKAELNVNNDPELCLKLCYFTVRDLLDLAGHPREKNIELFEYAASTKVIDSRLCKDVIAIFSLYSKMIYSPTPANGNESQKAFEHLTDMRNFLVALEKR